MTLVWWIRFSPIGGGGARYDVTQARRDLDQRLALPSYPYTKLG